MIFKFSLLKFRRSATDTFETKVACIWLLGKIFLSQSLHFFCLWQLLFPGKHLANWVTDWSVRINTKWQVNFSKPRKFRSAVFSSQVYSERLCHLGKLSAVSSALFLLKVKFQMFWKQFQTYNTWKFETFKQDPLCYPGLGKLGEIKFSSQPTLHPTMRKCFNSNVVFNII